jgi:hypothetical protein
MPADYSAFLDKITSLKAGFDFARSRWLEEYGKMSGLKVKYLR